MPKKSKSNAAPSSSAGMKNKGTRNKNEKKTDVNEKFDKFDFYGVSIKKELKVLEKCLLLIDKMDENPNAYCSCDKEAVRAAISEANRRIVMKLFYAPLAEELRKLGEVLAELNRCVLGIEHLALMVTGQTLK